MGLICDRDRDIQYPDNEFVTDEIYDVFNNVSTLSLVKIFQNTHIWYVHFNWLTFFWRLFLIYFYYWRVFSSAQDNRSMNAISWVRIWIATKYSYQFLLTKVSVILLIQPTDRIFSEIMCKYLLPKCYKAESGNLWFVIPVINIMIFSMPKEI